MALVIIPIHDLSTTSCFAWTCDTINWYLTLLLQAHASTCMLRVSNILLNQADAVLILDSGGTLRRYFLLFVMQHCAHILLLAEPVGTP